MKPLGEWANAVLGLSPETQVQLLTSVGLVLLLLVLRWMVLAAVHRRMKDPHDRYRWRKGTTWRSRTPPWRD